MKCSYLLRVNLKVFKQFATNCNTSRQRRSKGCVVGRGFGLGEFWSLWNSSFTPTKIHWVHYVRAIINLHRVFAPKKKIIESKTFGLWILVFFPGSWSERLSTFVSSFSTWPERNLVTVSLEAYVHVTSQTAVRSTRSTKPQNMNMLYGRSFARFTEPHNSWRESTAAHE